MFTKTLKFKKQFFNFILPLFILLFAVGCNGSKTNSATVIKITFHDAPMAGSTVSRIDMTILETQIIDINDNKLVISTEPHAFNLLEITKNNPVLLAQTSIAPGTYKQIRLISSGQFPAACGVRMDG